MAAKTFEQFFEDHGLEEIITNLAELATADLAVKRMRASSVKPGEQPRKVVAFRRENLFTPYALDLYLHRLSDGRFDFTIEIVMANHRRDTGGVHRYPKAVLYTHNASVPRSSFDDPIPLISKLCKLAIENYINNVCVKGRVEASGG